MVASSSRLSRCAGLCLLLLLWPPWVQGQETGGSTHEVERGDTLWSLATRYLEGGPSWRAIYDLNRSIVRDADLILPGQTLQLPGRATAASRAMDPGGEPASEGPGEAPGVAVAGRPAAPRSPQEDPFAGPSLFDQSPQRQVTLGGLEVEAVAALPLVSRSDFHRAPFLASKKELEPIAVTARKVEENPLALRLPAGIQLNQRVVLGLRGLAVQEGDELLAFKWRRGVGRQGRVAEPVAMVTVLVATADSARARVTAMFGAYQVGDPVIQPPPYPEAPPLTFELVEGGVTGRIIAFATKQPLLGLSAVSFLDLGAGHGVKVGDEFITFSREERSPASASVADALAVLRVVRVRPSTATALVVRMWDVGTTEGSPVRLVAQAVPAAP